MPATLYIPPYKALKLVGDSATEAEKDSVVQAHLRPQPAVYNDRVDTLRCFGLSEVKHKKIGDMRLADESYFAGSKYYHPERGTAMQGVYGDPLPYGLAADNLVSVLLIGCFLLLIGALSRNLGHLVAQAKGFFYVPKGPTFDEAPTFELRFQLFMLLATSLLLATLYYAYANVYVGGAFLLPQAAMLGVYLLVFLGYFCLKLLLYGIVNTTFFDSKNNQQFLRAYLFLVSVGGLLLFPFILLHVYFGMPMRTAIICVVVLVLLVKILQAYKTYIIFFRSSGGILQLILYLCTLELTPLMVLFGAFEITGEYLKVNY